MYNTHKEIFCPTPNMFRIPRDAFKPSWSYSGGFFLVWDIVFAYTEVPAIKEILNSKF